MNRAVGVGQSLAGPKLNPRSGNKSAERAAIRSDARGDSAYTFTAASFLSRCTVNPVCRISVSLFRFRSPSPPLAPSLSLSLFVALRVVEDALTSARLLRPAFPRRNVEGYFNYSIVIDCAPRRAAPRRLAFGVARPARPKTHAERLRASGSLAVQSLSKA